MLTSVAAYMETIHDPERMPRSMYIGNGESKFFSVNFPVFEEDLLNVDIDKNLMIEDFDYITNTDRNGLCTVELKNPLKKGSTLTLYLGDFISE